MPSLYSLASLAITFASLSTAVLASEVDVAARALDLTDNIMASHQLQKRRPNHADAYGYPHGLPKYHDGTPMTPGGYVNHPHNHRKPQNFGAKCKSNSACVSHVKLSAGSCQKGRCTFRCLGDTHKQGGACVGYFKAPICKKHHHCTTTIKNAYATCSWGKCIFTCNKGYHSSGNKCVKNAPNTCGRNSCPPVQGGWNECVTRRGKQYCSPQCNEYLGYHLYTNANHTAYKCINTGYDVDNCGAPGHRCKYPYNGKGQRTCWWGKCGIDCKGYRHSRTLPNGMTYCSNI